MRNLRWLVLLSIAAALAASGCRRAKPFGSCRGSAGKRCLEFFGKDNITNNIVASSYCQVVWLGDYDSGPCDHERATGSCEGVTIDVEGRGSIEGTIYFYYPNAPNCSDPLADIGVPDVATFDGGGG